MSAILPLRIISMMPRPRDSWLMAALKAYLDDSGSEDRHSICVAGYVGSLKVWDAFEEKWGAALDRHGLPYFHMKEVSAPGSPLHCFAGRENAPRMRALLGDLIGAIRESTAVGRFVGLGGLVPIADLSRFNRERGRKLDPVALALFVALASMKRRFGDQTIEVVVDQIAKPYRRLELATGYLATSPKGFLNIESIVTIPASGGINQRTVRPLQAADLVSYECFRKWERLAPFYETVDLTGADHRLHLYLYEAWVEESGRRFPDERGSLTAIGDATKFNCPILTYQVLCEEDDARRGIWA